MKRRDQFTGQLQYMVNDYNMTLEVNGLALSTTTGESYSSAIQNI